MKSKKGIIFALDGAIAISVVLIMLINTTYYFTTTSQESLSQSQVIKRGYDVIAMYDEAGRLDRALRSIESTNNFVPEDGTDGLMVSHYLPVGYNMSIELSDAAKTSCFGGGCVIGGVNGQDTSPITLKNLVNGGDLYVQVNALSQGYSSGNPSLSVKYNSISYPLTAVCDVLEECTYTTKERVLNFPVGTGNFDIVVSTEDISDEFEIKWVKVLDDPSYSLTTERIIPENRFIGGGERWYAAFDANGHFEGAHKVSFKVWIEGDRPE